MISRQTSQYYGVFSPGRFRGVIQAQVARLQESQLNIGPGMGIITTATHQPMPASLLWRWLKLPGVTVSLSQNCFHLFQ